MKTQAPSLNKLKQLLLQTGKKNWLRSNSMLHEKKELNRWAKVLMLSKGVPSPLPAGHRKTCPGELSPLTFFTGFPLPSCGWKLDSTYGIGWILFWSRLFCRWKSILHSFHILLGWFFFSPGILCCQINCLCGGSRGPSRGQRDHIFILQSPFYDHVQISQGNLKHSTPSLQEMGPPSGARSPTHIPTLPPSVKEAMYIVVECWLSLAQSQDFRTHGACTMWTVPKSKSVK